MEWTGTGIPTHSCCSRHPPFQICKMLKYNVEILKHTQGAGYVAHKSSLIWLFSDLIECDGKKTKPASLTASPAVMVATGSPSTLIASPSTPMALFPPPGMDGVPQPTVSTKELIIIIFMFCLWAYSLFLTYRFLIVLEGAMQDNGNGDLANSSIPKKTFTIKKKTIFLNFINQTILGGTAEIGGK